MQYKPWVTGPAVELTLYSDMPGTEPEALVGVIDTGASISCVDNRIAKRLGLIASDRKPVEMADGRAVLSPIYTAKMAIPALGFDDYVRVCGVEMQYHHNRLLIGRSFLRNYIVTYDYDGGNDRFTFVERVAQPYGFDHDE